MGEVVCIEHMSYGPAAIAHAASGKTLFVDGGVPESVVEVEVYEDKKSFAKARIVNVIESGPCAVGAPSCAASCGGCPWAGMVYSTQLEEKTLNVRSAFLRGAHLSQEQVESLVRPCIPSKHEWNYRNKVEYAVQRNAAGHIELGFHEQGSNFSCQGACKLAYKKVEGAARAIQGALRYCEGGQDLGLFRVGVRSSNRTGNVEVALWTTPGAFPRAAVAKTLASAVPQASVVRVMAQEGSARKIKGVEVLSGKGYWEERLLDYSFATSAPSFFQVNTAGAEVLVQTALEGLGASSGVLNGAYVADLYSGGGTFSIPLAASGAQVVAVESAGSSVRDLRRNAEINHVEVDVIGGDSALELPTLGELDALVVDPPRAGLAQGVPESIAKAKPEKIAYVSCDPQTLARDIARFAPLGYEPIFVQPVDLFPQTYHVETVVLLSWSKIMG